MAVPGGQLSDEHPALGAEFMFDLGPIAHTAGAEQDPVMESPLASTKLIGADSVTAFSASASASGAAGSMEPA